MKQDKIIKPFDNLLMAYITKEGQGLFVSGSLEKEAALVFKKQYESELPQGKANALLSSLVQTLTKDTLGSLVQKALVEKSTSVEAVQTTTGLTASLLEDIKSDMIFTNSIPIKSLGKLLKLLNISFEKGQAAINATFEKLSTENKLFLAIPSKIHPAFRKGMSNASGFDLMRTRSDESYLYQNKEALDKYTKRLGELYDHL
jgi:hypothetical protein